MSKKQPQKKDQKKKSAPSGPPKGGPLNVKVSVPMAYGNILTTGTPRINGGKSTTISHTEYLDDITSLVAFAIDPSVQVYDLNPGLITSFPWLGNMAAGYEQYKWKRLRFHYRARTSTQTSGSVYFSTQFDSADPDFGSKEEMYAYSGTKSTSPWLDMVHDCLLGRSDYMKKYFIRTGNLLSDEDSQLYDTGKFTFVPIGLSSGVLFGELLVEYEVELFNPKMNVADVGAGINEVTAGTGTASNPFAGAITRLIWGAADFCGISDGHTFTFSQPGLYQMSVSLRVGGGNLAPTTVTGPTENGDIALNGAQHRAGDASNWDWGAWVLVGLAGAGLIFGGFTVGTGIISFVKVSSSPLALATLLGTFTVADAGTAERMAKRFRKRNIRFVTEVKHGEHKMREVRNQIEEESSDLSRYSSPERGDFRERNFPVRSSSRGLLPK